MLSFVQMCCVRVFVHEDASVYAHEHARAHDGYNGRYDANVHAIQEATHRMTLLTNFCNAVYNRERERERERERRENNWFDHVHSYKLPCLGMRVISGRVYVCRCEC